jgi:hypothetical protein
MVFFKAAVWILNILFSARKKILLDGGHYKLPPANEDAVNNKLHFNGRDSVNKFYHNVVLN